MRTMSSAGATTVPLRAPAPPSTIEAHRAPRPVPPGAALVVLAALALAAASFALGFTALRVAGLIGVAAVAGGVLLHRRVGTRSALDPLVVVGAGLAVLVLTQA